MNDLERENQGKRVANVGDRWATRVRLMEQLEANFINLKRELIGAMYAEMKEQPDAQKIERALRNSISNFNAIMGIANEYKEIIKATYGIE